MSAAELFRAMSDPTRLQLLERLTMGEASVTELADAVELGLSTVSHQLRVLRSEHLVTRRREGKNILYSLADEHIVRLLANGLEHVAEHSNRRRGQRPKFVRPARVSRARHRASQSKSGSIPAAHARPAKIHHSMP